LTLTGDQKGERFISDVEKGGGRRPEEIIIGKVKRKRKKKERDREVREYFPSKYSSSEKVRPLKKRNTTEGKAHWETERGTPKRTFQKR